MRILGIDPGSSTTGYGVVESGGPGLRHVAHGTLRSSRRLPVAQRLHSLLDQIHEIVAQHRPDAAVVEQVFVAASPRAALILGQARGAVLAGLAGGGLPVHEYAATRIKLAVTGSGRADKRQVQTMVRRLLALDQLPPFDAADALAAAICHAHASRLGALGVAAASRPRSAARGVRVRVRRSP